MKKIAEVMRVHPNTVLNDWRQAKAWPTACFHQKKVLLIDIDPQTNLTFLCAPIEKWQEFKKKPGTIAHIYKRYQDKVSLNTKRYIWRSPVQVLGRLRIEGLDLIPCDIDLIGEDLGGGYITGAFPSLESLRKNSKLFLRERQFPER